MPGRDGYLRLIHWKEEEVGERVDRLEALGYEVDGAGPRHFAGDQGAERRPAYRLRRRSRPAPVPRPRDGPFGAPVEEAADDPDRLRRRRRTRSPTPRTSSPTPPSPSGRRGPGAGGGDRRPARRPDRPGIRLRAAIGQAAATPSSASRTGATRWSCSARRRARRPCSSSPRAAARTRARGRRLMTIWFVTESSGLGEAPAGDRRGGGGGHALDRLAEGVRRVPTDLTELTCSGPALSPRPGRHQGLRDRRQLVGPAVHPAGVVS